MAPIAKELYQKLGHWYLLDPALLYKIFENRHFKAITAGKRSECCWLGRLKEAKK
jgi:hypothetical protein